MRNDLHGRHRDVDEPGSAVGSESVRDGCVCLVLWRAYAGGLESKSHVRVHGNWNGAIEFSQLELWNAANLGFAAAAVAVIEQCVGRVQLLEPGYDAGASLLQRSKGGDVHARTDSAVGEFATGGHELQLSESRGRRR